MRTDKNFEKGARQIFIVKKKILSLFSPFARCP